jgi:hypothetical protein
MDRRYPPPPPGNAIHWTAARRRWADRIHGAALFVWPLLRMLALLLALALPYVATRHHGQAPAGCTLDAAGRWSCSVPAGDSRPR